MTTEVPEEERRMTGGSLDTPAEWEVHRRAEAEMFRQEAMTKVPEEERARHNHTTAPDTYTLSTGCPACRLMAEGYAASAEEDLKIADEFAGGPTIRALEATIDRITKERDEARAYYNIGAFLAEGDDDSTLKNAIARIAELETALRLAVAEENTTPHRHRRTATWDDTGEPCSR